jgi:hypothetical protein
MYPLSLIQCRGVSRVKHKNVVKRQRYSILTAKCIKFMSSFLTVGHHGYVLFLLLDITATSCSYCWTSRLRPVLTDGHHGYVPFLLMDITATSRSYCWTSRLRQYCREDEMCATRSFQMFRTFSHTTPYRSPQDYNLQSTYNLAP